MSEELILGRYRQLETAGQGAFGTVQVAWDTTIQRKVAIKCIRLNDAQARALHADAAKAAAAASDSKPDEEGAGLSARSGQAFADAALAQMADGLDDDADASDAPAASLDAKENAGDATQATVLLPGGGEQASKNGFFSRVSRWFSGKGEGAGGAADTDAAGSADTAYSPTATIKLIPDEADQAANAPATGAGEHWLADIPGLDEARTAAMLTDAHIVQVYDFQVVGNVAYLIMEYVEGMTLTRFLREYDDKLSLDIIAAIFADVSGALIAAHSAGVLHLDVKPDNILIDKRGQAKVTDFGLATLADAEGLGEAGGGTIGYMPLEQMRQEPLDARCDEWALASITYEMLAGRNPFLAPTLEEAKARITDAELVLPSLCWRGISKDVDDVIFTALEPEPEDRYDTVADFAAALQPLLGDPVAGHERVAELVSTASETTLMETAAPTIVAGEGENKSEVKGIQALEQQAAAKTQQEKPGRRTTASRAHGHFFGIWGRVLGFFLCGAIMLLACINMPMFSTFSEPFILEIFEAFGAQAVLQQIPQLQNSVLWALVVGVAVLAAIKPTWGAVGALCVLGISLIVAGRVLPGIVLIAATVLWWICTGRHGAAQSNCGLSYAALGAFGLSPFSVLATGIGMRVLDAMVTVLYGILVCFICAGFGSADILDWNVGAYWNFSAATTSAMSTALGSVQNWIIAASWFIAAAVGGLCTMPRKRWVNIVGTAIAVAVILIGLALGTWMGSAHATWIPAAAPLIKTLVCCAAGIAAAVLFVPEPYIKKNGRKDADETGVDVIEPQEQA